MDAIRKAAPLLLSCLVLCGPTAAGQERTPEDETKKDKDSVELVVKGCLKGRSLEAEEVRPAKEGADIPVIQARAFRVDGARAVLDEIKKMGDPSRAPQYAANAGVLHLDVTAVRVVAERCK
jgi:hypothetical protein